MVATQNAAGIRVVEALGTTIMVMHFQLALASASGLRAAPLVTAENDCTRCLPPLCLVHGAHRAALATDQVFPLLTGDDDILLP